MGDSCKKTRYHISVLSDTHGRLDNSLIHLITGSDLIVHAGDIDTQEVLQTLKTIAPVVAVRGNMDRGEWAQDLKRTEVVNIGASLLYILHDPAELDLDPAAAGISIVVFGHLHKASMTYREGVIYLNPGSPSFPRGKMPPSVAFLDVDRGRITPQFINLDRHRHNGSRRLTDSLFNPGPTDG